MKELVSCAISSFEQEIQETKEDFLLRSVIATTIIILLSSVCTYFLTKKALTPLQKLTSEVSQIQAQNLSTQLAVPNSKDEIAQLTSSFNEMLARLDNAFSTQKQFSANAAHELRTPLAVLQTNLERRIMIVVAITLRRRKASLVSWISCSN